MPDSSVRDTPLVANVSAIAVDSYRQYLGELSQALSPVELEEAARFRRRADLERFTLARALIRVLCASLMGCEPKTINIFRTASGKPFVESRLGIEFNVSHSGNCVLIAWSTSGLVGVDVESIAPGTRPAFLEMAARAFSAAELAVLRSVAAEEIAATFYRIWVRKEAVLKAEGVGVSGPLRSFSVAEKKSCGIGWRKEVLVPAFNRIWEMHDLQPAPGFAACLAAPAGTVVRKVPVIPGFSEHIP